MRRLSASMGRLVPKYLVYPTPDASTEVLIERYGVDCLDCIVIRENKLHHYLYGTYTELRVDPSGEYRIEKCPRIRICSPVR